LSFNPIWTELEDVAGAGEGEVIRRIHPEAAIDLFLAVAKPLNQRMIMLAVESAAIEDVPELPSGKGITSQVRPLPEGSRAAVELLLVDRSSRDIFTVLAADMARAVIGAKDSREAVGAWVARLRRWQRLLAHLSPTGLSPERQRALYAELWLLREHLVDALGPEAAVHAWTGPDAASHDFELAAGAVEVKSTAGKQHQVLRISSERQLDDTGVPVLYLFHLSLDVRQGDGQTLPEAVAATREALAESGAASVFEDRLLTVGYTAAHEPHYQGTNYTVREFNYFHVDEEFPRITEADLVPGVGDVRYSVTVAECKHFLAGQEEVLSTLRGSDV
jgi:hypothetical protein